MEYVKVSVAIGNGRGIAPSSLKVVECQPMTSRLAAYLIMYVFRTCQLAVV